MTRAKKLTFAAVAFVVVTLVVLAVAGPALLRPIFYPKPKGLPPIVGETIEQLLNRLQAALETNAPIVARALQAGLSDSQISALETRGGFQLSDDLKALYRWHNGMPTNSPCGLLPGHRFLSLEEIVVRRTELRRQLASATLAQRTAFPIFGGYSRNWVQIIDDNAGDGYFYDPDRSESVGAFFYHMAEERYYLWFPSLKNFLSGVIECYESKVIKLAPDGVSLIEDAEKAEKIWSRVAENSEAGN